MHVYSDGEVAEFGDRHARYGRKCSPQSSLNIVQGCFGSLKKIGKTTSCSAAAGNINYHVVHISHIKEVLFMNITRTNRLVCFCKYIFSC